VCSTVERSVAPVRAAARDGVMPGGAPISSTGYRGRPRSARSRGPAREHECGVHGDGSTDAVFASCRQPPAASRQPPAASRQPPARPAVCPTPWSGSAVCARPVPRARDDRRGRSEASCCTVQPSPRAQGSLRRVLRAAGRVFRHIRRRVTGRGQHRGEGVTSPRPHPWPTAPHPVGDLLTERCSRRPVVVRGPERGGRSGAQKPQRRTAAWGRFR